MTPRGPMTWSLLLLAALSLPGMGQAASVGIDTGYSIADPEELDWTAREAALSGSAAGLSGGACDLFSNPAGLSEVGTWEGAFHSRLGWVGTLQETLLGGVLLAPGAGVGFSGSYLGYGDLPGRDDLGDPTASYSADQWTGRLGAGLRLVPGLSLGAALRVTLRDWDGVAGTAWVPSLGVVLVPLRDTKAGLYYQGLGWGDPMAISQVGGNFSWELSLGDPFRLLGALGGTIRSNGMNYLQAGTELSFQDRYFLRVGYRTAFPGTLAEGFSTGAGLSFSGFTLDYAFLPSEDLGSTHRFSLGYSLEGEKRTPVLGQGSAGKGTHPGSRPGAPPSSIASKVSSQEVPVVGHPGTTGSTKDQEALSIPPTEPSLPALSEGSTPRPKGEGDEDRLKLKFSIPDDFMVQAGEMEAQGKTLEAVRLYQEALKEDPKNAQAWWKLGSLYLKAGRKTEALQCLQKASALRPGDRGLREWLDKMGGR